MAVITISSPWAQNDSPNEKAARLMLSVVPRVKMTSWAQAALMCRATARRASSKASVHMLLSRCTPRCMLLLQRT